MNVPRFPQAKDCTACRGDCPTPEACQLPIARATRPPRLAFLLATVLLWLAHPVLKTRLALLRWSLDCVSDELSLYVDTGRAGVHFARRSRLTQLELMGRIRELEGRLQ